MGKQLVISQPFKQRLKRKLWHASPNLLKVLMAPYRGQRFSIGIFTGETLLSLRATPELHNPVLTTANVDDVPAAFVADPFMIEKEQRWYMFFEVFNRIVNRGVIALATSPNGREWRYEQVVLEEPFHLAYPSVIEWDHHYYLIPDSPSEGVLLYEATEFPRKWRKVCTLIDGTVYSDSSVFRYADAWWMLTAWAPTHRATKSLRLFHAEALHGPWQEHPASPVVSEDNRISRPAGTVCMVDGRPVRFAQDTVTSYGREVRGFEVVELSATAFREREIAPGPILCAGSASWNAGGMHHVDAHRLHNGSWIACVDGWSPAT